MENNNQTIQKLIDTQKRTLEDIERLNLKFEELTKAIEKVNLMFGDKSIVDTINDKLENINKIDSVIQELNKKLPDLKIIEYRLVQTEAKVSQFNKQLDKINSQLDAVESSVGRIDSLLNENDQEKIK